MNCQMCGRAFTLQELQRWADSEKLSLQQYIAKYSLIHPANTGIACDECCELNITDRLNWKTVH